MSMRHRSVGSYPKQDYYGSSTGGGNSGSGGGYGNTSGGSQSYGGYNPGSGGGGGEQQNSNSSMYYGGGVASQNNSKTNKPKNNNRNATMLLWACVGTGLWAFLMMGLWWNASGSYKEMLTMLNVQKGQDVLLLVDDLKEDVAEAKVKTEQKDTKALEAKRGMELSKLEKEKRYLQKERDELRVKYEGPDKKEEESRVLLRDEAFKEQLDWLQESIKIESKRTVIERYVRTIDRCL
jgi:hypothetical protein